MTRPALRTTCGLCGGPTFAQTQEDVARKPLCRVCVALQVLRPVGPWVVEGLCAETDPELFFPANGRDALISNVRKAKNICAQCPVRLECLSWAMDNDEPFGIWGGLTQWERIKLRRQRKRESAVA